MHKKPTIGLLVSGILDDLPTAVCKGAMRVAEQQNVNLIIVPGKYINRDLSDIKGLAYEYQYNTLFSYVGKNNLDAVMILADSIGCYATKEHIRELIEQYKEIPHILIASKLSDYISVNYDNYNGIKEGLEYLIKKLKCTKIGMIGGSEDNTDARERKNTFFEVLKENNIVLNNLSKSDSLTGIRNRRGFYDDAEKILKNNKLENKATLVAYVDMNNLKIINDKFGHDSGDFSIKLISELLTKCVSNKGITGRIGGDEFAVIISYDVNDEGECFREMIYDCFEDFNVTSDKPYLVKVSVGACVLNNDSHIGLKEALISADEKLYDEKQKRSKNVIKDIYLNADIQKV